MLSATYIIEQHPLFVRFSPEVRRQIAEHATVACLEAGEYLLRAGQVANQCYLIGSGAVELESNVLEGMPVVVATLGPGEILGWSCFFEPQVFHFDARATQPTSVVILDARWLHELCAEDDIVRIEITRQMRRILAERRKAVAAELC